jgi:hypothetical protein
MQTSQQSLVSLHVAMRNSKLRKTGGSSSSDGRDSLADMQNRYEHCYAGAC